MSEALSPSSVLLTTRAAEFITRCNLSDGVTFGDPTRPLRHCSSQREKSQTHGRVLSSLVVKTRVPRPRPRPGPPKNCLGKTHTFKTVASKKLKFSGATNCNKYNSWSWNKHMSNWQKQASNHMKWVRQIHGWYWKIVKDRHFETKAKIKTSSVKTKTKTAKNRSQAVSRPSPRSRGLQDWC